MAELGKGAGSAIGGAIFVLVAGTMMFLESGNGAMILVAVAFAAMLLAAAVPMRTDGAVPDWRIVAVVTVVLLALSALSFAALQAVRTGESMDFLPGVIAVACLGTLGWRLLAPPRAANALSSYQG